MIFLNIPVYGSTTRMRSSADKYISKSNITKHHSFIMQIIASFPLCMSTLPNLIMLACMKDTKVQFVIVWLCDIAIM